MVWKPTFDVIVSDCVHSCPLYSALVFPRVIKLSLFWK